ncbi:unnamed protein product [Amaranthus hypochondriacus]
MEKKEPIIRKLLYFSALPIFTLLLFFLHQQHPFPVYSGEQNLGNRRNGVVNEEVGLINLQLKLRRLVREKDIPEFEATGFVYDADDFTEVKPYPRREDPSAMEQVTSVQVIRGNSSSIHPPACEITHDVPALLYSFAGFAENPFHAFNELIIPLFLTSYHFESKVQFVLTDFRGKWYWKYTRVLKELTSFENIGIDPVKKVHCFPSAVVGLRYHNNLAVNSSDAPVGYTMQDVKRFLWNTYNVKVKTILYLKKPKVLLFARRASRTFLNENEMVHMMENELGFEVYKALPNETKKLDKFAKIVSSCEIMVGAHGAGLTNAVFLPTGAALIQIVPLGLNWASDHYFGEPAPGMGLKYIRYKVWRNETSLYEKYGPDNPIVSDAASIWAKGYAAVKQAYVDEQSFRINLPRFKETLLEALRLIKQTDS